jgi:hypothetical protein
MPADAVTVRQDVVLKDVHGTHDRVVLTKYEAPMESDGVAASDPYKARDIAVARTMMAWLEKHYPGHMWGCIADLAQGIVKFNIPILMGVSEWWVVNLRTHDVIDGMRIGAGQILERYRLPRGRFHLASFLEARAKHSKLVVPSRKVPE